MTLRGVCRRVLKLPSALGRLSGEISYCRQPDSGNPTVRDERGAEQKRELWRTGNPPHISKECESETLALRLRALLFYPTVLCSVFRRWDLAAMRVVAGNRYQLPGFRPV
jgi:hypothetical protein